MFNKSKILSLILCICLIFEQVGFAQVSATLDISTHLANLRANFTPAVLRPLHLRYLSYNPQDNKFQVFLDRGSLKEPNPNELQDATRDLLNYFLVGVSLPNDTFWVNLRPDAEGQIIDDRLARTDVGRIMLEADLQLKKDTARFTSPENPEGKRYWDKLYKKAGEIFGSENIAIPTLTRPWIVPGEIIISETTDSAYIYKATLKVMLEQDYLKDSVVYNFKDHKQKELNEYSSQLIREIIIPKLTKEINSSKRYAALRQVYYSLIMAQWFKARFSGKQGKYYDLINSQNLHNLTSKEPWSKTFYFKEYQKNFQQGEYNVHEQVYTPYGQSVRSYFSGGMKLEAKFSPLGEAVKTKNMDGFVVALPAFSSSPLRLGQKMRKILVPILLSLGAMGAPEMSFAAAAPPISAGSLSAERDASAQLAAKEYSKDEQYNMMIEDLLRLKFKNEKVDELIRNRNIHGLAQLASNGDPEAADALVNLASINEQDQQLLNATDVSSLVQLASNGDLGAVTSLQAMALAGNEQAKGALNTLDLSELAQLASRGDVSAFKVLEEFATGMVTNEQALKLLKTLDVNLLAQLASEGDVEAANILIKLDSNGNKQASDILGKLDVNRLSESGENLALTILKIIAHTHGHKQAKQILEDLQLPKLSFKNEGDPDRSLASANVDYVVKSVSGGTTYYSNKNALPNDSNNGSSPLADENKGTPDEAVNQELLRVQKKLSDLLPDNGGYTEKGRNRASRSLIEKIVEEILIGNPGSEVSVVEVGMGNNDAPTYRELRESMLAKGVKVGGIEAFEGHIPFDLNKEVALGTILNPQGEALELIRNANIIRISNLVQYLLYFNIAERIKLLEVMKKEMKEGALLILTRTFKPGYEEGIIYVKKGTELILESFVFTVRMDEEGDLMAGADVIVSRYDKQGLFGRLIIDPLREELKDYKPGKEAELNSALPGLLVGKLKEEYRDDVKQLGEMVSINFEKLRGLIQIIDKESQKEFLEEMAGLIPGAAGEATSSPLAKSSPNAYEQELARAQKEFRMRSVIGSVTTERRNSASQRLIEKIVEETVNSGVVPEPKVVDIGLGASGYRTGAPTFRELVDALGGKAEVSGIELLPENIPDDLKDKVAIDNILNLNPQGKAVELIQNADIVRISNLVLGYFNVSERVELLRSLKTLIKKDGALLIVTNSFESEREEGFIYAKKGAELILGRFIFTVRVDENNRLSVGTNNIVSRLDEGGLLKKLIFDSLEADENGYLYNNQIGNKKEFNLGLPALTAEKIKERYPDFDVRQIGEMVSIGFNDLYALIQSLGEDAKKKILEKMSGLIPGVAGESVSSPLAEGKKESYPSAVGGIDFRSLPIVTQAVSNLSANLSSSAINNLVSVNLDREWSQIEGMANAGIIPSAERIKEYIQSSCTQENISRDKDKIVLCISDILRQEEERGAETDSVLRDVLVVLESMQGGHELREIFLGKLI